VAGLAGVGGERLTMNTKKLTVLHALIATAALAGSTICAFGAPRPEAFQWFLPVLLFPWFMCAVGLLFQRQWAWRGSFGMVVLYYLVLGYFLLQPVPGGTASDPSGFLMIAGIALMVPFSGVILLLLVIRRRLFGGLQSTRQQRNSTGPN